MIVGIGVDIIEVERIQKLAEKSPRFLKRVYSAEEIKIDGRKSREILPVVRPVIEKIASIVDACLQKFDNLTEICLVGGTCELDGFDEIVQEMLRVKAFRPEYPQFITPLGIALSCLDAN